MWEERVPCRPPAEAELSRRNVYFGTEVLDNARRRLGLTNDQVWTELGIGESTWMRWKREGAIPLERLTEAVLLLELPEPDGLSPDVPRNAWQLLRSGQQVAEGLANVDARLRRIEEALGIGDAAEDRSQPARAARRAAR